MKFLSFVICLFWTLLTLVLILSPAFPADTGHPQAAPGKSLTTSLSKTIPTYVQKKIFKKIWKRKEVDFPISSVCIGDIDGDGLNELISTDQSRLRIVQWKYGRFRLLQESNQQGARRFFSFWSWSREALSDPLEEINRQNHGMRYVTLTAEDLNGDGRDEVLFIGIRNHELYSGILGFRQDAFFQDITEAGLYLKIFQDRNGRPVLAGQSLNGGKKEAHEYLWENGSYRQGTPFDLPENTDIFDVSSYRSDDPAGPAYVSFCSPGDVCFFSSDQREITKLESLRRSSARSIRIRVENGDGKTVKKRVRVPPRFITADLDADGRDNLLLILKRPAMKMWGLRALVKRDTVANFVHAEGKILEFWNTEPIFADILDQAVGDVDNDGREDLVLITESGLMPFSGGAEILIYELR